MADPRRSGRDGARGALFRLADEDQTITIPAVERLFEGPLEPFADSLTLGPLDDARPGRDLLDPKTLRGLIDRLAAHYGHGDRRAVASLDLGAPAAGVEAGLALMAARRRGGRHNPLYAPVRYPAGGRVRRVCCIRYLAPGVGYCGTCPIAPEGAATADCRHARAFAGIDDLGITRHVSGKSWMPACPVGANLRRFC